MTSSGSAACCLLPPRRILEREEVRALLGDTGIGLGFEGETVRRNSVPGVSADSWQRISREVMNKNEHGSNMMIETAAMPVKFGCLVRCVIYSRNAGGTGTVHNMSMEFVPNARIEKESDPDTGHTRNRLA